mgnify:CR=1 FL=1
MSKRWSYLTVEIKHRSAVLGIWKTKEVQDELNRHGQLGWELINIIVPTSTSPAMAVFKRES